MNKDREGGFPHDFHRALADAGWLGIAMPEEYGGAGPGISEAALMMHTISASLVENTDKARDDTQAVRAQYTQEFVSGQ